MIIIPPPKEYRRPRARASKKKAPPAPLTLVEAEFTFVGPGGTLRLEFDRAINLDGFSPSEVTVQDPSGTGWAYVGTGVVDTPDPQTVVVEMGQTGSSIGGLDVMSATGATGIVAEDDATPWAGVTALELPFP